GVAVFRERVPEHGAATAPGADAPPPPAARESSAESGVRGGTEADDGSARSAQRSDAVVQPAPLAKLGTGHGTRERSYVEFTDFTRADSQPNESVRIPYDTRHNPLTPGIILTAAPPA